MKSIAFKIISMVFGDGWPATGAVERHTAPAGHGKQFASQWAAGRKAPQYHHISRQVRRREQRKAMKRMGVK